MIIGIPAQAETHKDVVPSASQAVYELKPDRASIQSARGYVRVKEAALIVGFHPDKIRQAIGSGELVAYQFGKQYRIATADLEMWIESNRVHPYQGFLQTIYGDSTTNYRW
jgi:excisionase family DNA binding protein